MVNQWFPKCGIGIPRGTKSEDIFIWVGKMLANSGHRDQNVVILRLHDVKTLNI